MNEFESASRIRDLNDQFRTTLVGGKVLFTPTVSDLSETAFAKVLLATQTFTAFDANNDPYHEHDFGSFEVERERYFFKIDYYGLNMTTGSENPADSDITTRVLTIMHASEY